jgi:hypothetical protein
MLVFVGPLLVLRLPLGVRFRPLVLLLLSFCFSVHTGNTSFSPIDSTGYAMDTTFFYLPNRFFLLRCPPKRPQIVIARKIMDCGRRLLERFGYRHYRIRSGWGAATQQASENRKLCLAGFHEIHTQRRKG